MHTTFWPENLKGRDLSEYLEVDGIIKELILEIQVAKVGTGLIWLRIGANGGLL
jgi:hypothetical protein